MIECDQCGKVEPTFDANRGWKHAQLSAREASGARAGQAVTKRAREAAVCSDECHDALLAKEDALARMMLRPEDKES